MSTQILTELPNIQKAGMDFDTVMNELRDIIKNNPNWRENWPEFYDSEAGVMLTQIMAWIADNLSTRQDMLYNEMFIGTAQDNVNKIRHLKHIGYIPQMPHAAKVPVLITTNKLVKSNIFLTPPRNGNLSLRPSEIFSFNGRDINGKQIFWEIIKITDGKPDYLNSVALAPGSTEYREDKFGNTLYALQGKTIYEEFNNTTSDGSYFDLREKNISADSLQVYLKSNASQLLQVNSFVSKDALDDKLAIPYILEMNEDMSYRIRFGSKDVLGKKRLLPAGSVISVFYRTCDGSKGNISPAFINNQTNVEDDNNEFYNANIFNELLGYGGTDQETLDRAVLNGPLSLRTMDRAVTPEDYNVILERNPNIFKVKTYTATNQPDGFKGYYGRYINPQESFSIVMLNKNYNKVPTSRYNYFPWLTTEKEPRLNEKYVFDNGNYNSSVDLSRTDYNIRIMEAGGGIRNFKNCTVLNFGDEWNNNLYGKDETPNNFLRAKITTKKSGEKYFKNIPFSIFNELDTKTEMRLVDKEGKKYINYLSMDDNARFVSKQRLNLSKPIDVSKSQKLNIVVDGMLDVSVDLWAGAQFKEDDMPSKAYLLWDNDNGEYADRYIHDSTMEAAKHRYGIVQIINMSINSAIGDGGKFKYLINTSRQYAGITYASSAEAVTIGTIQPQDMVYFSLRIKGTDYLMRFNKKFAESEGFGQWGSLNCVANYLQYIFVNGTCDLNADDSVKKVMPNGDVKDIEPMELMPYSASAIRRVIFDTDYDYDEDENSSNSSGSTRMLFDIAISNKEAFADEVLTNVEYVDIDGFKHTLKKVVDIQDPSIHKKYDDHEYVGLFEILTGVSGYRIEGKIPQPTQAADYSNLASISLISSEKNEKGEEINIGRLVVKSPTTGSTSSICFQLIPKYSDFGKNILGIGYNNGNFSDKAYGVKKLYLMKSDALSVTKVNNGIFAASDLKVKRGNVIFENSCIYNDGDFDSLYVNYKIQKNDSLKLGSVYDNFYYSGDDTDDLLKEDVVGLEGQYVGYNMLPNGVKKYYLDKNKSKFNIKFTKEKQNTNSLYSIKDDLGVIGSDRVRISTGDVGSLEGIRAKLIFSIDKEEPVSIDVSNCTCGAELAKAIKDYINNYASETMKKNVDTIIKTSFFGINQLIFQSIDQSEGSIKFYFDTEASPEENNELYKILFGTNKSNKDFYILYPKAFIKIENVTNINNEEGKVVEYYYHPAFENDLVLTYKKLIKNSNGEYVGANPDYYIEVDEMPLGDQFKYTFNLVRTENSNFPDNFFYVHFVNDKTHSYDRNGNKKETDEAVLQNYMYKYKISGTDVTFVQPYFKTYDIAATIKYNNNFSETEVVQNVSKSVDEVCDLKYSNIAGSMSRAKIFKAIMNCPGVEDCKITYFGYDYETKEGNSDELKSDFYEILCLHENVAGTHGKIFTFEINE